MQKTKLVAFCLGIGAAMGAESPDLAARKLFYQDNEPELVFKAVAVSAKANLVATAAPAPRPAATFKPVPPAKLPPSASMLAAKAKEALAQAVAAYTPDGTPVRKAQNMGVRYNVLKVNPETADVQAVPADTNFKKGDCLAIRLSPNRGGFLYVFNQGTSGKWQPLLPSEDLPGEPSTVRAYQVVTIPGQNCFEMDDPAGEERLFVMITEKPEDVKSIEDMLHMMNKPAQQPAPGAAPQRNEAMVLAMNKLSDTIQGFQNQLASRDIKITRVNQPASKTELPYTVYLTNTAASASDRLIMEIKLKHN